MIPYILALRNQTNVAQAQAADAQRRNRQLQGQVGAMSQEVTDSKQNVASTEDTVRRLDPKIAILNRNLGEAAADLGNRVATVKDSLRQTSSQLTSVGIKADQALNNTVSLGSNLDAAKSQLQNQVAQLNQLVEETASLAQAVQADSRRSAVQIGGHLALHDASILRYSEAMSGNLKLYAEAIAADLSAAVLNAAEAGTVTRDLVVSLVSEMGEGETTVRYVHPWALLPAIITAEASADPDIDPPTVKDYDYPLETPQFRSGLLRLAVTMDTDAGATKTYVAGDSLTVTVKVSADSTLLGWAVADFVMTYNVIA